VSASLLQAPTPTTYLLQQHLPQQLRRLQQLFPFLYPPQFLHPSPLRAIPVSQVLPQPLKTLKPLPPSSNIGPFGCTFLVSSAPNRMGHSCCTSPKDSVPLICYQAKSSSSFSAVLFPTSAPFQANAVSFLLLFLFSEFPLPF
jgi:hypothetical protein